MPHRPDRGFTLIELLIVVVIIGILAAIAIPRFSAAREKAYMASVVTDLKVFATQQEAYLSRTQTYATSLAQLSAFALSEGVNISINQVNLGAGWAATAWHDALPLRPCGLFYGNGDPAQASPATQAGAVTCTP